MFFFFRHQFSAASRKFVQHRYSDSTCTYSLLISLSSHSSRTTIAFLAPCQFPSLTALLFVPPFRPTNQQRSLPVRSIPTTKDPNSLHNNKERKSALPPHHPSNPNPEACRSWTHTMSSLKPTFSPSCEFPNPTHIHPLTPFRISHHTIFADFSFAFTAQLSLQSPFRFYSSDHLLRLSLSHLQRNYLLQKKP